MNVESDIQAIGKGWQWPREGLITIQQLFSKPDMMAECSEEIAQFLLTPYPGAGLSGRLDSAVSQGRQEINQIPLDLPRIQTFLGEIDDDVELAKKGQ
eukprot:8886126-Pyramimonas_sp.AAC.1